MPASCWLPAGVVAVAEHGPGHLVARVQEVLERAVEVVGAHLHDRGRVLEAVPVRGHDSGPAQELLEEGRGDPVGPVEHAVEPAGVEIEPATVELDQSLTGLPIRQVDVHRLVHSPGTRGQRRLQQVGPVRGQEEDHVGVLVQTVHLVEQREHQRGVAAVMVALLRDQVDVLDHDHGGLERPGDRTGLLDRPQGVARELDDRRVRQLTQEIADGVRLADPRWAIEQQPTLEMLSRRAQPIPVAGHADHLATYVLEGVGGQDQCAGVHSGSVVEAEERAALPEHRSAEGDNVTPIDVVFQGQAPKPFGDLGGETRPGRHRLDGDSHHVALGIRPAIEERDPILALRHQKDGSAQTFGGLPGRAGRQADRRQVPGTRPVVHVVVWPEQVAHAERPPVAVVGHADGLA